VAIGELGDGVVGGVDVALEAAQGAVAALGLDEGDVFAGFGQVGEAAVAELVQGPPGGGLEDLLGAPVGEPGQPSVGVDVAGGGLAGGGRGRCRRGTPGLADGRRAVG